MPASQQGQPQDSAPLATSRESHGYDGIRHGTKWWFEAWGNGSKSEWKMRSDMGRPPTPDELRNADYIVIGLQRGSAVGYKTKIGGIDL